VASAQWAVVILTLWLALPLAWQVPVQVPSQGPAAPSPSLTQGVWLWTRTDYGDGSVLRSPDPNAYTLAFMDDGHLAIRADCNSASATYTVNGSMLSIQPGPMTLAACPPGSQDTVFLRDLFQVATYVFDGPRLVLNMRLDSGSMVFSPQSPTALAGPTELAPGLRFF
jgi:heat shock protein HslJ